MSINVVDFLSFIFNIKIEDKSENLKNIANEKQSINANLKKGIVAYEENNF